MKKVSFVYDVDYTLLDGYHPSILLERRGLDVDNFWQKVSSLQKSEKEKGEHTDSDIIYLALLLHEVKHGGLEGLSLDEIKAAGVELDRYLYPGLPQFFTEIRLSNPHCNISHNVVSVGIKPLIEHSVLGHYMEKIFGYTFFDSLTPGNEIDAVKTTTSKLEKIAYVINISTGEFNDGYKYPIKDMVYFGDGQTDKEVFRFVKKKGGISICVYDPNKEGAYEKALQFRDVTNHILPADYRMGSKLVRTINDILRDRC